MSRRTVLRGSAAMLAAAVGAVACSSKSRSKSAPPTTAGGSTATPVPAASDLTRVATMAGVEVAVIGAYTAGLAAVHSGKLEPLSPVVTSYITTAQSHHQAALDKWNAILTSAHRPPVSDPPPSLQASFTRLMERVLHSTGLPRAFLTVEQTASDTYLAMTAALRSPTNILLAAQLQIVGQEHTVLLHYISGGYPAPGAFQDTNLAFGT